jgi:hypothetical protein
MKEAHPASIRCLLLSVLILSSSAFQALAYYHPDEGRWLSNDPIEADEQHRCSDDQNLYGFAANNAVSYWDYLGLKTARFVPRKIWIIPLPDKLIWDLDERENARIKELEELIKCLDEGKDGTTAERQKAIEAARAYIQAIKDYAPSCGRACVPGYTCTFNFERYEGNEPAWKELLAVGFQGYCCGFKAGIWVAAMCPGCQEGGFDPNLHEDQEDGEWHYHWDEQPHDKRGGGPHWDRGKTTGPKPRQQEWSPDGRNWYPK